jgi:hypothetical protein
MAVAPHFCNINGRLVWHIMVRHPDTHFDRRPGDINCKNLVQLPMLLVLFLLQAI